MKQQSHRLNRIRTLLPLIIFTLVIILVIQSPPQQIYSYFQSPIEEPTPTPVAPVDEQAAPPEQEQAPEGGEPAAPEDQTPSSETGQEQAPLPEAQPESQEQQPSAAEEPSEPDLPPTSGEEGGVVINRVKLIDTLVQWFAYLWLCIGVGVLLLVPLVFLFLQIRGSRIR